MPKWIDSWQEMPPHGKVVVGYDASAEQPVFVERYKNSKLQLVAHDGSWLCEAINVRFWCDLPADKPED